MSKKNTEYTLFLDMDECLTNFDGAFMKLIDDAGLPAIRTPQDFESTYGKDEFNTLIRNAGIQYWSEMAWMPDGKQLWRYVNNTFSNVIVLTAPMQMKECFIGKKIWLQKNLHSNIRYIIDKNKARWCSGGKDILIDDRTRNTVPWKAKGGVAILHKNTSSTIRQVQKILATTTEIRNNKKESIYGN